VAEEPKVLESSNLTEMLLESLLTDDDIFYLKESEAEGHVIGMCWQSVEDDL